MGGTVRQLEVDAMGGNRVRSMVAVSAKAILELQLCDVTWDEDGSPFLIRKTKNDTKSRTKSPRMEYDSTLSDRCMLSYVKQYVLSMHGEKGLRKSKGCTTSRLPAERCVA